MTSVHMNHSINPTASTNSTETTSSTPDKHKKHDIMSLLNTDDSLPTTPPADKLTSASDMTQKQS